MRRFILIGCLAMAGLLVACSDSGGSDDPGADVVANIDGVDPVDDTVTAPDVPSGEDVATVEDVATAEDGAGTEDVATTEDGAGTGDGAGAWCDTWTEAYCALLVRCPHPNLRYADETACRAAIGASCYGGALVDDAVTAGALAFDAAAADDCLAEIEAMDCAAATERLRTSAQFPAPVCSQVLVGTLAAGEPCSLGNECAAGAYCDFAEGCPGICVAYAAVGDTCDPDNLCDFTSGMCDGGTCAATPAAEGDACLWGYCQLPLVCDRPSDTCAAPALEGEACGADAPCYPGLLCFGADASSGTCSAPRGEGDSCFENTQCVDLSGGHTLVCAGGRCERAPSAGDACYDYQCDGAWCDTQAIPPTCEPLPTDGEACGFGSLCGPDLFCDDGTCAAKHPAGGTCEAPLQCVSGRCIAGRCLATGQPPCGGN